MRTEWAVKLSLVLTSGPLHSAFFPYFHTSQLQLLSLEWWQGCSAEQQFRKMSPGSCASVEPRTEPVHYSSPDIQGSPRQEITLSWALGYTFTVVFTASAGNAWRFCPNAPPCRSVALTRCPVEEHLSLAWAWIVSHTSLDSLPPRLASVVCFLLLPAAAAKTSPCKQIDPQCYYMKI